MLLRGDADGADEGRGVFRSADCERHTNAAIPRRKVFALKIVADGYPGVAIAARGELETVTLASVQPEMEFFTLR